MAFIAYMGIWILEMFGFEIIQGDLAGGGDEKRFVPLDVSSEISFGYFSIEHIVEVANIFLVAVPFGVVYGGVRSVKAMLGKTVVSTLQEGHRITLTVLSLGYLSFIISYGFDLGYPVDLDLMLSMSLPLSLLILGHLASELQNARVLGIVTVVLSIVITWSFLGSFMVRPDGDLSLRRFDKLIGRGVNQEQVSGNIIVEIHEAGLYKNIHFEKAFGPVLRLKIGFYSV